MTPVERYAVPVICLIVLAALAVGAIRGCTPSHHRQSIRYRNVKGRQDV